MEHNKMLVSDLYDALHDRSAYVAAIASVMDRETIIHNVPYGFGNGVHLFTSIWTALHAAFSDLRFEMETLLAEGDQVAVRGITRGIHVGPFAGRKATGRSVGERAHVFYRVDGGTIREIWPMVDRPGLLRQLADADHS